MATRATPHPAPTLNPQVTYAIGDDVPNYLLRLDTSGRVAVEHRLMPSRPDGDNDRVACGG
ncbi:MAG: hypothetical protein OXP73_08415 [Chloroflexota bacterium]|nr:hypothetical protein [Chloroflexota bacterium]